MESRNTITDISRLIFSSAKAILKYRSRLWSILFLKRQYSGSVKLWQLFFVIFLGGGIDGVWIGKVELLGNNG